MGDIRVSGNATWRDWEIDGVPSSGAHEPAKADIRATMGVVEDKVAVVSAGNGAGFLTYADLATMNADTTQADHVTAQNLEDDNIYRWNDGGSAWVLVGPNPNARLDGLEEREVPGVANVVDILARTFPNYTTGAQADHAYNTSGAVVSSTGRFATDLIKIDDRMTITRFGSAVTSGSFPPYAWFDEDKAFIDYDWTTGSDSVDIFDVADAPAGAAYVGLTATNATVEYYIYQPKIIELIRDQMFAQFGTPVDVSGQLTNQYVNKSTGIIANSSSFRLTPRILLDPGSYISCAFDPISPTITSQASLVFFGPASVKTITAITKANPGVVTAAGHGFATGQLIDLAIPNSAGMTQLDGKQVTITVSDADHFSIGIDTSGYTTFVDDGATATGYPFLGYYNPVAVNQTIKVADIYPTAVFFRAIMRSTSIGAVYVVAARDDYDKDISLMARGLLVDYFAPELVSPGRLTLTGGTTQPTHAFYRVTPYIAVVEGQEFLLTAQDATALGAAIAAFDADKGWIKNLVADPTGTDYTDKSVIIPAGLGIAYIRAFYRNDEEPFSLISVRAAQAVQEAAAGTALNAFGPDKAYGRIQKALSITGITKANPGSVTIVGHGLKTGMRVSLASIGGMTELNGQDVTVTRTGADTFTIGVDTTGYTTYTSGGTATVEEAVYLFKAGVVGDRSVPVSWSPDPPQAFATFQGSNKVRLSRTTSVIDTVTVSIASPAVVSHSGHDIVSGQGVILSTDGALPTGLTAGVEYFAKNIVAGTSYELAATVGGASIDTSGSQSGTHKATPQIKVDLSAMVGTTYVDLSEIRLQLLDSTALTSPTKKWTVIVIGNSTTSQLSTDPNSTDGNGTWVNEMARQITGTGDPALVVAAEDTDALNTGSEWAAVTASDIRYTLGLSNIFFRGTRGSGTIKHEGRGGWHPINYLERTDDVGADGKSNAFWDPDLAPWGPDGTTWQFSMKYYIENNGWDVASLPASGVDATGSNLLVIFELGWNDAGNLTEPAVSAGYMGYLADKINEEYPDAKVWVAGMWAPPEESLKGNTGSIQLKYSAGAVFDLAVRQFGTAYRNMAEDRSDFCEFVQVSHQIDPDFAFSKATMAPNPVVSEQLVVGTGDHVHMRRRGYAMLANIMADKFLYDYCRGV